MNFTSIRVITDDVARLAAFYERVSGCQVSWATPDFAELVTDAASLAIAGTRTLALFGGDIGRPAANQTVILEFRVADVDAEYRRLRPLIDDWVQEPTTMPWGNRSVLLRDPDGNLVNLFTPVTGDAIKRSNRSSRAETVV